LVGVGGGGASTPPTMANKPKTDEVDEKDFDFSVLWNDEEETGGFTKFAPILGLLLNVVVLIMLFLKK
jgi:hypothetical protein